MAEASGIERRITLRLLAYWEKLRQDRPMPSERDIDPDDLEDLWDNCFLIHVQDLGKADYNFTYLGQAIVNAGLFEPSPAEPSRLMAGYPQVVETRKPLVEQYEFRNLHNEIIRYRQCLLPLGEGDEVQAIFGGMRFKVFPSEGAN